jgi:hypothetical protein
LFAFRVPIFPAFFLTSNNFQTISAQQTQPIKQTSRMQISKRGIRVIRTVVQVRRASCVVPKEAANLIMKDTSNPLNATSVGLNAVVGEFFWYTWEQCGFGFIKNAVENRRNLKKGYEVLEVTFLCRQLHTAF